MYMQKQIVESSRKQIERQQNQIPAGTIQCHKTDARKGIDRYAPFVKAAIKAHIFDATPTTGAVDKKDPQGLHAYKDGGSLASNLEEVSSLGKKTKVHGVEWRYSGETATKKSSMFPNNLAEKNVLALIAIEKKTNSSIVSKVPDNLLDGLSTTNDEIKTIAGNNLDIDIQSAGDTVYPVATHVSDWL